MDGKALMEDTERIFQKNTKQAQKNQLNAMDKQQESLM